MVARSDSFFPKDFAVPMAFLFRGSVSNVIHDSPLSSRHKRSPTTVISFRTHVSGNCVKSYAVNAPTVASLATCFFPNPQISFVAAHFKESIRFCSVTRLSDNFGISCCSGDAGFRPGSKNAAQAWSQTCIWPSLGSFRSIGNRSGGPPPEHSRCQGLGHRIRFTQSPETVPENGHDLASDLVCGAYLWSIRFSTTIRICLDWSQPHTTRFARNQKMVMKRP